MQASVLLIVAASLLGVVSEPLARPAECGPELVGTQVIARPGSITLLGELHGTAEIPSFVGNLACRAALQGLSAWVGLEIPAPEQPAIDRYLAGAGSDEDRRSLLSNPHWQRAEQDGRSSSAILGLIEKLRLLKRRGVPIGVFAFDAASAGAVGAEGWNRRDQEMAENILRRARENPEAVVITLSGNLHNRKVGGLFGDASRLPMGVHVAAGAKRVISLDVRHAGGSAWMCFAQSRCGEHPVRGQSVDDPPGVELNETASAGQPFDGWFVVGTLSASPPAVRRN